MNPLPLALLPLFLVIQVLLLRRTPFDLLTIPRNPAALLWALQTIPIPTTALLISAGLLSATPFLPPSSEGFYWLPTSAILITFTLLHLWLALLYRPTTTDLRMHPTAVDYHTPEILNALLPTLTLICLATLAALTILGYRHAVVFTAVTGAPLISARLHNSYYSGVPSQLLPITFLYPYLAAYVAGRGLFTRPAASLLCMLSAFLLVTARGDKAPVVYTVLLFAHAMSRHFYKHHLLLLLFLLLGFGMVATALLGLVHLQYDVSSLNDFLAYLVSRVPAQLSGVYITFELYREGAPWPDNLWQAIIPSFARSSDFLDFHRFLMLYMTGAPEDAVGGLSTYFIAEALAIGGPVLLWTSPLIVALAMYAAYCLWRVAFMTLARVNDPSLPAVFTVLCSPITAQFSAFPLLKTAILWLLLMTPVLAVIRFRSRKYASTNVTSHFRTARQLSGTPRERCMGNV